jgi:hypothetical protein
MHLRRILRLAAMTRPRSCGDDQLVSVFFAFCVFFFSFNQYLRLEAECAATARTPPLRIHIL